MKINSIDIFKCISPQEFSKIIDNMLRRIMFFPLLMLFALPLKAQQRADSVYEFRFVAGNDMFFVPYENNRAELERLSAFVRQYHDAITAGRMPVYVDGYCNSLSGEAENLTTARLRSNRVKSEFILHENLSEDCFVTHNHPTKGDWVTVSFRLPEETNKQTAVESETAATEEDIKAVSAETIEETPTTEKQTGSPDLQSDGLECRKGKSSVSLRFNLLRWATLTPDLGLEWRINPNIGILLNGSGTSWSWSHKDRRYALWKLSPEVRYYIGKEKRGFVGAIYHIGEFNYKLGNTGKQGDYQGGGITGGYRLQLSRTLALDFHAAMGYTRAEYDKYTVTDGIHVRGNNETKNYWGINQVGITLVWKFVK